MSLDQQPLPRRATARLPDGSDDTRELADWRSVDAYVLLAEPGAGKTTTFRAECEASDAVYRTARDLLDLSLPQQWRGKTLFIDGLDQMLAGASSRGDAFGAIRKRLDELGHPRFRIACREADWYGSASTEALRAVAPGGTVAELRLEPLTKQESKQLLRRWPERVPDVDKFWREAEQRSLAAMLANPLLLELMVDAVHGNQWPATREETYDRACKSMVVEHDKVHRAAARGTQVNVDQRLDDSGLMFAVMLLANAEALSWAPAGRVGRDIAVEELALQDAMALLSSKLLLHDGDRCFPRHRTIAEYLAARSIAERIANRGLPVTRVLALMTGFDGGIVEPLRGLHAWLAVHCLSERELLIERDPLGVVLYGDVQRFTPAQKRQLLTALHREAKRFVWFRNENWASHPFGALGTSDMTETFRELLTSPDRDEAHQSLLDCVLDAMRHGESMPKLALPLEHIVRDGSYWGRLRDSALAQWVKLTDLESDAKPMQLALLDDIEAGLVDDPNDELVGELLHHLYPAILRPTEIFRYLRAPRAQAFFGVYQRFWAGHLVESTPGRDVPALADAFAAIPDERKAAVAGHDLRSLVSHLILRGLKIGGESEPVERVYRWLGAGLDKQGHAYLSGEDAERVREWLANHPAVQKAVLQYAFTQVRQSSTNGRPDYGRCEQRFYQARRPPDWFKWHLEQAAQTTDAVLAEYGFSLAAAAAVGGRPDFDISVEYVEQWIAANHARWPQVEQWRIRAWSSPIDSEENYQRDEYFRTREYKAEESRHRQERRASIEHSLSSLRTGDAPAQLMHDIALAYKKRFTNIRGDTELLRVQDLLGGTLAEASDAIAGIEATLTRTDLPTVEEILALDLEGKYHYLRPPCLLGAELACDRSAEAPLQWDAELASRLVAFHLTDGFDRDAGWYMRLVQSRPTIVATVLVKYAKPRLRRNANRSIAGLWALAADDNNQAELARLVSPQLLQSFPARASEAQLNVLLSELLPASRHLMDADLKVIVKRRLAMRSLDAGQRIAWLMTAVRLDAEAYTHKLLSFVGDSQARAEQLGRAMYGRFPRGHHLPQIVSAIALGKLIEILAPLASPDRPMGAHSVGDAEHRRDLVNQLINQLTTSEDKIAVAELRRLRSLPPLSRWSAVLDGAHVEQVRRMRAAAFEHASAASVVRTLSNKTPANAQDLAALVVDHLRVLEKHIRGYESTNLPLFWRPGKQAGQLVPKIENDCRDLLLDKLRDRLLLVGVNIGKEEQAANDKRADLRASAVVGERLARVPIEIKMEDDKPVWSAWRDQLDRLYTGDPAAQNVGIYLVLWFGHHPTSTADRIKPTNARQMEGLIREGIPADDRVRLPVVVLDLSQPPA